MVDKDFLSTRDAKRLEELGVVFESAEGRLLTQVKDESFDLVELFPNGSLPIGSVVSIRESPLHHMVVQEATLKYKRNQFLEKYGTVKMSPTLADYLWSSEEGDDQIEFRSPVPGLPPHGKLMVVNSKQRRKKRGYEYCLAACEDGAVRWIHESESLNNGNCVWTVHWFDLRGGGAVYFGDRLQRPVRNVYINVVNNFVNEIIGNNVNGSGTQNIAPVTCG